MADPENDPDKDKNFRTYIPQALWDEYYYALGKFMTMFARCEVDLNATISNFVNSHVQPRFRNSLSVTRAILGGQRLREARITLKRLLKVTTIPSQQTNEEKKSAKNRDIEIDRVLGHLSEMHFLRDRIAHNGASPDARNKLGYFKSHNDISVRDNDDMETIGFKPQMLLDAARDLEIIPKLLSFALNPATHAKIKKIPDLKAYEKSLYEPFHYKPSQLKREGPKSLRNQKLRPPQPDASQASPKQSRRGRRDAALSRVKKKPV